LDLSNKDIGRATSNSETGTPIVTTAKTAGLAVPNSHIVHITNSITTKPIKRPFIAVLIIAPKAASAGGLFHFVLRGSGFVFARRSISLSAAERFSSAPISRAFSSI
jgi:hypothetical protein